jgi:hypothetical protein
MSIGLFADQADPAIVGGWPQCRMINGVSCPSGQEAVDDPA